MTVQYLAPNQLKARLEAGEKPLLLDVRTPEEFVYLGHIPGATLLPIHELPARYTELDPAARTVVICQHGVRSLDAAHYLAHLGFQDVYNMLDGMSVWDGPLEHTAGISAPGNTAAPVNSDLLGSPDP